jgi:hypothetical protein
MQLAIAMRCDLFARTDRVVRGVHQRHELSFVKLRIGACYWQKLYHLPFPF